MTLDTLTPISTRRAEVLSTTRHIACFAAVAAETADWLADRVVAFERCGKSRPGTADRLRRQAFSYRRDPQLVAAAVA